MVQDGDTADRRPERLDSPWRELLRLQDRHAYLRILERDAQLSELASGQPWADEPDSAEPEPGAVARVIGPAAGRVVAGSKKARKRLGKRWDRSSGAGTAPVDPDSGAGTAPVDPDPGAPPSPVPPSAGPRAASGKSSPPGQRSSNEHKDRSSAQTSAAMAERFGELGVLDLDAPMHRNDHPLLRSPAALTRTATNFPDPAQVHSYLAHSADLTLRAGSTTALSTPLAACTLAEHYVFRRIGGSSAGAAVAAAVAAAELGRTTPPQALHGPGSIHYPSVQPGFAGLAQAVGWLAGQDVAGGALADGADLGPPAPGWPEQHRLARMFQPSHGTRDMFRLAIALARMPQREGSGRRGVPILAAMLATSTGWSRLAAAVLWAGAITAWAGLVTVFARSGWISTTAVVLSAIALGLTFAIAAAALSMVLALGSARSLLRERADAEGYGLVPGITEPDMTSRSELTARLDRLAGVLDPNEVPALTTWLADRIDDLAGIAPGADDEDPAPGQGPTRRALTFGELWLGRLGPIGADENTAVERACADREHRVIDLALSTTNVSQGRPYTFPMPVPAPGTTAQGSRFLFCRACLSTVLPVRVVAQMVLASPASLSDSSCPRHPSEELRELPEPWDLPVIAAVRMSLAVPGLLRAVPLCTLDVETPTHLLDPYGRAAGTPPAPPNALVPRVHWFVDGGLSRSMSVSFFDSLLPRWPTFALAVESLPVPPVAGDEQRLAEWVAAPEQDAAGGSHAWRRIAGWRSFVAALGSTSVSWRDTLASDLPGLRGRIATVRQGPGENEHHLFIPQRLILELALRGAAAGTLLRERFTGADEDILEQTQTDRYRWIRLRMALREYREMSLSIAARLPLYSDLASSYRVPKNLTEWFTPPLAPGSLDPASPDAAAAIAQLRALSAGGVLDWDTDYGAAPVEVELRITPTD